MTKKAQKYLSTNNRRTRNQSMISFNRSSFTLGNLTVITDNLSNQARDLMIEYYREKQFDKELYQRNSMANHLSKDKQNLVLMQDNVVGILNKIQLKGENHLLQSILNRQKAIEQIVKRFPPTKNQKSSNFTSQIYRLNAQNVRDKIEVKQQMKNLEKEKENHYDYLKQLTERKCLQVEQQIFIQSIVMIIEKEVSSNNSEDKGCQVKSIVIFEQSYPSKEFEKLQLIEMIGQKTYELKLLAGLKIYHYSITSPNFFNSSFLTCHNCMKVISSIEFPQAILNCPKQVQQHQKRYITSKFTYTPFSFMKRIIQKDHFSSEDESFSHSYIQYFSGRINQEHLACNRRWCGACVSRHNQDMRVKQCQFCSLDCKCLRCKRFSNLVKLLGYFMNFGGKYDEIKPKFFFSRVFDSKYFNPEEKEIKSSKQSFPDLDWMRKMHEKYVKNQLIDRTQEWKKMENFKVISGSIPQSLKQYELLKELWQDQKMKSKRNPELIEKASRKEIPKRNNSAKKAHRIQSTIEKVNEETKKRFIESQNEQQKVFLNQILSSGVLRSSNPCENPFFKDKKNDVITQRSETQKKEMQFLNKFSVGVDSLTMHRGSLKDLTRSSNFFEVKKKERSFEDQEKIQRKR